MMSGARPRPDWRSVDGRERHGCARRCEGARSRRAGLRAVGGGDPRRLGRRRRQGRTPDGRPPAHYAKLGVVPHVEGFNILFEQFNRNKRGVAIDLRNDDGRARARRADRVGRRVHHELPPVDAHEAAAAARRRVGGQPALRLRDRQRARPRKARTPSSAGSTRCRSGRGVASATSSRRRALRS